MSSEDAHMTPRRRVGVMVSPKPLINTVLTEELLTDVLKGLDGHTLCSVGTVCKLWSALVIGNEALLDRVVTHFTMTQSWWKQIPKAECFKCRRCKADCNRSFSPDYDKSDNPVRRLCVNCRTSWPPCPDEAVNTAHQDWMRSLSTDREQDQWSCFTSTIKLVFETTVKPVDPTTDCIVGYLESNDVVFFSKSDDATNVIQSLKRIEEYKNSAAFASLISEASPYDLGILTGTCIGDMGTFKETLSYIAIDNFLTRVTEFCNLVNQNAYYHDNELLKAYYRN
jgi:uncharacterized protein (UPF0297 family)